jgi:hypothetical protein
MIKVTLVFDNYIASPLSPLEFLQKYYLTEEGNQDIVYVSEIEQEFMFEESFYYKECKLKEPCKAKCEKFMRTFAKINN